MRRLFALGVLAAALALVLPGTAVGLTLKAPGTAPARLANIDVQLWPEDTPGSTSLIIVGQVPTSTPLPATVVLPLPAGATPTWAGELLGSEQKDISRNPRIDAAAHTLTVVTQKSRLVQYEAQYTPYKDQGGRRVATVIWPQIVAADKETFAFKLPVASDDVHTNPPYMGQPAVNGQGEKLYTLADRSLKAGETFTMSVDYIPRVPGVTTTQGSGGLPGWLLPTLFVALGAAVVALLLVIFRRGGPSTTSPGGGAPGWDEDDDQA